MSGYPPIRAFSKSTVCVKLGLQCLTFYRSLGCFLVSGICHCHFYGKCRKGKKEVEWFFKIIIQALVHTLIFQRATLAGRRSFGLTCQWMMWCIDMMHWHYYIWKARTSCGTQTRTTDHQPDFRVTSERCSTKTSGFFHRHSHPPVTGNPVTKKHAKLNFKLFHRDNFSPFFFSPHFSSPSRRAFGFTGGLTARYLYVTSPRMQSWTVSL